MTDRSDSDRAQGWPDGELPEGPTSELLKRALENVPESSSPRPEFRDSLRAQFVRGALREDQSPGDRMQRALDATGSPSADAGFRESLRAQFVGTAVQGAPSQDLATHGVVAGEEDGFEEDNFEKLEADFEAHHEEEDRNRRGNGGGSSLRIVRWMAPLALAAAAVMLLLNPAVGSKPKWEVIEFPSSAAPLWDGQSISAVELLPADRRWNSIETGAERLRLKWSDELLIEVGADSEVTWEPLVKPRADGPLDPDASPCLHAGKGGVNFTARDSEKPIRLFVETPDAKIELRGTTVGIDLIEGLGTCVCVLEGTVTLTTKVGDEETLKIEEGTSCFIFSDGRGATIFELHEEHGGPVREFAGDGARHFAAAASK